MSSGVTQSSESSSKPRKIPKPVKTGSASKIRAPTQSKVQNKPVTKAQTKPSNPQQKASSNSKPTNSSRPQRTSGIKAPTVTKNVTKLSTAAKPLAKTKKTAEPRTRHKRTARAQTSVIHSTRTPASAVINSPHETGPVAPPRSGAGIKRSVTTRQSPGSKPLPSSKPSKLTKHPSLEMERGISSESNSNESVRSKRQHSSRVLKTKQVSSVADRSSNQPKRAIKRPSTRIKPDNNRSRDNCKENIAVRYTETPNLPKSKSKESLSKIEMPNRTRRSSLPSVIINPAELLLNRTLHDKLAQNQSNRHGFILTDTDVSIASLSSEFLSASNDERSDQEVYSTSDDLNLKNDQGSVSDSNIILARSRLVQEATKCEGFETDKNKFAKEITKIRDSAVKENILSNDISSRIADSSLNDLSDPNRSPSLNINPDEAYYSEGSSTVLDTSTLRSQDLQVIGLLSDKSILDKDWNAKAPGKEYTSPDDNFQGDQTTEKELYYDSSDLNMDSSNESINKEINTDQLADDKNMSVSLKEKPVRKDFDIPFPENNDSNSEPNNPTESPNEVASRLEDILSPLSNDSDPLAILNYSGYRENTPIMLMGNSFSPETPEILSAPSSVTLSKKFPNQESFFRRSQRSIHPKKSKQLVRSTSLDKKYLTKDQSDLYSGSLESFGSGDIYIVQNITPISVVKTEYLSAMTPQIRITGDTAMFECIDAEHLPHGYPAKRRFITRTKQRHDVARRFSETQVFKHHKEKYMKRKEMEEKYNSCPVSASPDKLDSPRYIKGLVKRVSSMLTPSSKPRVLIKKADRAEARDSVGSDNSVFIDFGDTGEARSLHDEMPDAPQNLSGSELGRPVKRCNSLEFDEISSIRRALTDRDKQDTDSPEHGLTHKAKSISEQLERFKPCAPNPDSCIPPLEFKDWTDFVPASTVEGLTKKKLDQQHHIWELVTTEHNHITILSTIINDLLSCLRELHTENFLTKIHESDVFLNIEKIRDVHLTFWHECIVPLIQTAKDTGDLLNPEILSNAGSLFEEELNPLFEYCIKYIESRSFVKTQQHKNNDFKEYINWCDNQTRSKHNKLELDEILIKPIQRIQKYPYIIKDILKKTLDDDTRRILSNFHEKVSVFVESLNRRKEEKEEQQKIEHIKERIESYSVLPINANQTNEQINQLLSRYNKFDLADRIPFLNKQRKFIHENPCKLSSTTDSKAHDVILFLFSDHILITRPNKSSKKKNRIIKQPLTLDRVVIEELKDSNHTNLLVYLNEYGSLTDMFLLQSANQESQTTLLNAVTRAKDNYIRDKNNLYTELDASKSISTTSVNSSSYLTSPSTQRHQACSITRSSSEHYPPTRRVVADASTSVSRAQSMPASNDKRVLHVEQNIAASSASSSASSSSASVSDQSAHSIDSSAKSVTLSDIKESDKGNDLDDSDEMTIKSGIHSINKYGSDDIYISDNLSTEFKGKLDMNKTICDSVLTSNEKEYFSKTDNIYLDNEQS